MDNFETVEKTVNRASSSIFEAYINAFRNYFNFEGRTSRYDYWGFTLINFILGCLLIFIPKLVGLYGLLVFVPNITIFFRRLHDVDKSISWYFKWIGFLILLGVLCYKLTFLAFIFIPCSIWWQIKCLYLICCKGHSRDNEWGDPIIETPRQKKTSKIIIGIVIGATFGISLLVFGVPFSKGVGHGIKKGISNFAVNKTITQIDQIAMNVFTKYSNGNNFQGLNNLSAMQIGAVPEEMYDSSSGSDMIVSELGKEVVIENAANIKGFKIHLNGVSVEECNALTKGVYPPNARLRTVYVSVENVGDGVTCDVCGRGCIITYVYK